MHNGIAEKEHTGRVGWYHQSRTGGILSRPAPAKASFLPDKVCCTKGWDFPDPLLDFFEEDAVVLAPSTLRSEVPNFQIGFVGAV
jgi:hypothetical protein